MSSKTSVTLSSNTLLCHPRPWLCEGDGWGLGYPLSTPAWDTDLWHNFWFQLHLFRVSKAWSTRWNGLLTRHTTTIYAQFGCKSGLHSRKYMYSMWSYFQRIKSMYNNTDVCKWKSLQWWNAFDSRTFAIKPVRLLKISIFVPTCYSNLSIYQSNCCLTWHFCNCNMLGMWFPTGRSWCLQHVYPKPSVPRTGHWKIVQMPHITRHHYLN